MSWKGKFNPKHPDKYAGDANAITYRSRIELRYFQYFDNHPDIVAWNSEETVVPYIKPTTGRVHRYFPDVLVKKRNPDGSERVMMIEFKCTAEANGPKPPKNGKQTRRFISESITHAVNQAKWQAARAYCADRGWEFSVMTEKELGKSY